MEVEINTSVVAGAALASGASFGLLGPGSPAAPLDVARCARFERWRSGKLDPDLPRRGSVRAVDQDYLFEARQMQALSFAVHIPLVCFGIAFRVFVLFMRS